MSLERNTPIHWREHVAHEPLLQPSPTHSPNVVLTRDVYAAILAHTHADLTKECAGLLLGCRIESADPTYPATVVCASKPIPTPTASATHFTMDPQGWPSVWRVLDDLESEILGWYHSHPGHGAFLSPTDRSTQTMWFRQPWHIALVVDPIRHETAVFCGPQTVPAILIIPPQARADGPKALEDLRTE